MQTVDDDTRTYAFCPEASKAANFDVFAAEVFVNEPKVAAADSCSATGEGEEIVSTIGLLGIGGAVVGDSIGAETEIGAFEFPVSLFRSISKSPTCRKFHGNN